MAPVIKREAPEASSSSSTADPRSQDAKHVELQKVVNLATKRIEEHKWQSWWSWNSERQSLEKQKKTKPKPAADKNQKPEQTVEDDFNISYRCETCDRLFPKKLELEWHLREHTGVRPLPCGLCPVKFLNGRLLTAHHTRHHGLNSKWKRCCTD